MLNDKLLQYFKYSHVFSIIRKRKCRIQLFVGGVKWYMDESFFYQIRYSLWSICCLRMVLCQFVIDPVSEKFKFLKTSFWYKARLRLAIVQNRSRRDLWTSFVLVLGIINWVIQVLTVLTTWQTPFSVASLLCLLGWSNLCYTFVITKI